MQMRTAQRPKLKNPVGLPPAVFDFDRVRMHERCTKCVEVPTRCITAIESCKSCVHSIGHFL